MTTPDPHKALRDALDAGPTDGPWKVIEHSWSDTSIVAPGFVHGICCLDINYATEESQNSDEALMAKNAAYIAAANPASIRALLAERDAAVRDAERYRLLRRGQHWSVINGIGDELRADQLDAAIDAMKDQP